MRAFLLEVTDRPGELARQTAALASHGVNVFAVAIGGADRGAAAFLADDEARAIEALDDAGIPFRHVPVVTIQMKDRPGQAALYSRRLADAGINIHLWLPIDTRPESFTVAVGVEDFEAATEALGIASASVPVA